MGQCFRVKNKQSEKGIDETCKKWKQRTEPKRMDIIG
jgi:hypothetical protein